MSNTNKQFPNIVLKWSILSVSQKKNGKVFILHILYKINTIYPIIDPVIKKCCHLICKTAIKLLSQVLKERKIKCNFPFVLLYMEGENL